VSNLAFHDYHRMIARHKREFDLHKKKSGTTNPATARFEIGGYEDPVTVEGVFEALNMTEDLSAGRDGEHIHADMKLTTTPRLLDGNEISVKDRVVYNGVTYFVHKIRNDVHYGNFLFAYLRKMEGNV